MNREANTNTKGSGKFQWWRWASSAPALPHFHNFAHSHARWSTACLVSVLYHYHSHLT